MMKKYKNYEQLKERLIILVTPSEKQQLLEKAKENNTTLSLLVRKRIFDYDDWFQGINLMKKWEEMYEKQRLIEKREKGE